MRTSTILQPQHDRVDLQIISMRKEGNGAQNPELFKRPAEKVLRELIGDFALSRQAALWLPRVQRPAW